MSTFAFTSHRHTYTPTHTNSHTIAMCKNWTSFRSARLRIQRNSEFELSVCANGGAPSEIETSEKTFCIKKDCSAKEPFPARPGPGKSLYIFMCAQHIYEIVRFGWYTLYLGGWWPLYRIRRANPPHFALYTLLPEKHSPRAELKTWWTYNICNWNWLRISRYMFLLQLIVCLFVFRVVEN